jgi:hypothetical protein
MRAAKVLLLLLALSCRERSTCEEVCLRVARCKAAAQDGEPIPGEPAPGPDARCMKRCTDEPEAFNACEAKNRTCKDLRSCYGPLQ